jgi:rubrerythrin
MKYEEIKVVKQAIISEIEGHEFYKLAAKEAPTEDAKAAFLEIAEEELKHIGWLKSLYYSLMDEKYDLNKLADLEEVHAPNFFKWENLDRAGAAKAISVFGIGIQMEKAAVEFYGKAAEETQIPEAKKLYSKLSAWERVHMEQFSSEYEKLLEEWWNDQEFAPF